MYDILLRGGSVADGTGAPLFRADVGVIGNKIAAIGDLSGQAASIILDADGLVVAPGFIDAHSHSDTSFLTDSSGASKLYQGITTEITGNCGDSPFPCAGDGKDLSACVSFERFLARFREGGYSMAVNQALLVGHGTLRRCVIGDEGRAPTEAEMEKMRFLLSRELAFGAWGLSLGLEYAPGCFAGQRELNLLGETVKRSGGIVTCHMRSEGLEIEKALEELIEIGRFSGVRVNVSHLKIDNYRVHGRAPEVWRIIEEAQKSGVSISADMYPYTASCTDLSIRCPKWSLDGGAEALLNHLAGPRRSEVVGGIRGHYFNAERAETCLICDDGGFWPAIVGKTLRFVAEELCRSDDYAETAARILERTRAQARCIFFVMSPDDMLWFLRHDVGIGSDGYALPADIAKLSSRPHPRSFGAISEFLRLAREEAICPLEEAVRRITAKPAFLFGLSGRGTLKIGNIADVTVFDPSTVAPRATYLNPVQTSVGVRHVLINGEPALLNGEQTEKRAGTFLRKGR